MSTPRPTPRPAIDVLLATLGEETAMLGHLSASFSDQLAAMRDRNHAALDAATQSTNEAVHALDALRQKRQRQLALVARLLGVDEPQVLPVADALVVADDPAPDLADRLRAARDRVRHLAQEAQQKGQALEFALQYAMNLGRDVMTSLHGSSAPAAGRVYTAGGYAAPAAPGRTLFNTVG